jgi:hypothetical protein
LRVERPGYLELCDVCAGDLHEWRIVRVARSAAVSGPVLPCTV